MSDWSLEPPVRRRDGAPTTPASRSFVRSRAADLAQLLSNEGESFNAALSAAAAAAAAAVAGVALPPMMIGGGGGLSKKKARKAGHPLPVAFPDASPEDAALEAAAAAAGHEPPPPPQHRVRSHANSGSDILLLLHDR